MLFILTSFKVKSHNIFFDSNIQCIQVFSCANCRVVKYQTANSSRIYPSSFGCNKSGWGHNWAFQGCLGDRVFICRRCKLKLSLEFTSANISSDNCTIGSDDSGRRHDFFEIR